MALTAYNPNDQTQASFLSSLALGETGSKGSSALFEGTGGSDLSNSAVDQYGFPIWGGLGDSHAAGIFQFQPGTWDAIASQYNLNFSSAADQEQAAWIYAQQTYTAKTGGDLQTALTNGDYSGVSNALKGVWPSVTGNGASTGLVSNLTNGVKNVLGGIMGVGSASPSSGSSGPDNSIGGLFTRGALIIIGALIALVALWYLLSSTTGLPSPGDTAKAAVKVAAL